MFYFNLKDNEEDQFRQGMAGVWHIALNGYEYWDRMEDAKRKRQEPNFENLFFDTLCGRRLRFNNSYSSFRKQSGPIRNCCEYCATEYEPEGPSFSERQKERRERERGDLPF